jgi:2-polyprenyl-3-methyl-5-hydroxy-6-metoxy-1,4-benzoquinol methylase
MATEQEKALREKAKEQLDTFLGDCKIQDFRGKRILEVGFKNGIFLDECYKAGLSPVGLEVVKAFCDETSRQFPHLELVLYDGGTFPVPDASFDFVVSFQVLEHVRSIEHIFSECIRVLRPGGIMYHVFPNYKSFYEGHYAIMWLPFLNKPLGRLYLRMLGRYTVQFEGLTLVKPRAVAKALRNCKDKLKIISLGRAEFVNKFNRRQIDKVNQKFLRAVLKGVFALPLLKDGLLNLIALGNLYYPITVIARRL